MNTKRFYYFMIGMVVFTFCLVIGGAVYGNKLLQDKSAKLLEAKLNSRVLDEQQIALAKAKRDIAEYSNLERTAKAIVPQDKDQARTVREIVYYANESKISLQGISFPTSNLGQAAPATTGPDGKPVTTPTTPSETQVKPVEGIKGVYQLDIIIQSDAKKPATFDQLINFLSKLEQNRRTAQVTGLTITPKTENRRQLTFTLNLTVYIKP